MPLSVAQILTVIAPNISSIYQDRLTITEPQEAATSANKFFHIYDRQSDLAVKVSWSSHTELELRTERQRIDYTKALLDQGIRSLEGELVRNGMPPLERLIRRDWEPLNEAVVEVDFS